LMVSPIFIHINWLKPILIFLGIIVMVAAVLIFIAGDTIFKLFKFKSKYDGMTEDQITAIKRKQYAGKIEQQKMDLEMESQQLEIAKKRLELAKLRESMKQHTKSEFPDVLGNLSDIMGGKKK
jgi:hypothetical protein